MDAENRHFTKSGSSLLKRPKSSNVRQALAERMVISEALAAALHMIRGYSNGGAHAGRGYLGAIAEVLMQYPRAIALRAADVNRGVPRECQFMPTPADVIAWCERHTEAMRQPVESEDRDAAFQRDRERMAADEEALAKARQTRPTYDELKAKYGPNWGINDEQLVASGARQRELIDRANKFFLNRDDPSDGPIPVSASLRKVLRAAP